jgi:hypothetical protein
VDRTRLQRVEPRPTPRHATANAPAAPEFEPRDEVAVNHAETIGVQWFTSMAMLPNRMSNVAEHAGRSQEQQSKCRAQRFSADAKNGAFGGAFLRPRPKRPIGQPVGALIGLKEGCFSGRPSERRAFAPRAAPHIATLQA